VHFEFEKKDEQITARLRFADGAVRARANARHSLHTYIRETLDALWRDEVGSRASREISSFGPHRAPSDVKGWRDLCVWATAGSEKHAG